MRHGVRFTRWSFGILLAVFSVCRADPPAGSNWKPVSAFTDEFEGSALDAKKWGTVLQNNWKGTQPGFQTANNVTVSGGRLQITTKAESVPEMTDGYKDFTCGCAISKNRIRYGYFEVKAKANKSAASSTFWFYNDTPTLWTEIDVFELSGGHAKLNKTVHMNVHVIRAPGLEKEIVSADTFEAPAGLAEDFHTYGLEWDVNSIKWYFDGKLIRKIKNDHWTQSLHLVFDSETITNWFGLPDKKDLPAVFEIEYVRAWQKQ